MLKEPRVKGYGGRFPYWSLRLLVLRLRLCVIAWASRIVFAWRRLVLVVVCDYFGMLIIPLSRLLMIVLTLLRSMYCDPSIILLLYMPPPTPAHHNVVASIGEPLFTGGDFNVIVSLDERSGGSGGLMEDSAIFSNLISRRDLVDMGFSGSKFTLCRGATDAPIVSKRLDKFLMNIPWDEAFVRHLPAVRSDHNPLLLSLLSSSGFNTHRSPFRFEARWLTHPGCLELIENK
ncbi:hypothetical protein V2J09_023116 [Rumex salicifolius]